MRLKVNFELNNWFYKSQPFVVAIFLCSKTWKNKKVEFLDLKVQKCDYCEIFQ
nr:hypothetical protein LRH_01762 [Lacticaseibacillus rhamnosus HN001]